MVRIRKLRVAILSIAVAGKFVAGIALADPLMVEALGLDVWHIGQLERDLRQAHQLENRLEDEHQMMLDRTSVHNLIMDDLVAGRTKLPDAAARKWAMNRDREVVREFLNRARFGPTFEAKMAHDLYVLACDPCVRPFDPKLEVRLRAEYDAAYGTSLPVVR